MDARQLRHLKSGAYLTVNRRQSSEVDKAAARIDLDETGNDNSWCTVTPFYKLQRHGDAMRTDDKVALVLSSSTPASYLTACDAGPQRMGLLEVNAGAVRTRWRFQLCLRGAVAAGPTLRDCDVVRLCVSPGGRAPVLGPDRANECCAHGPAPQLPRRVRKLHRRRAGAHPDRYRCRADEGAGSERLTRPRLPRPPRPPRAPISGRARD